MKPLGKAIKVALDTKKPIQDIDDLLVDSRSIPHVVIGIAPCDMLLRGGYRTNIPSTGKPITNSTLEYARQQDEDRKESQPCNQLVSVEKISKNNTR